MKKKLASVRKYVDENRTYLAFCAGSVLTSGVFYVLNKDKTLLQVNRDQLALLKAGGGIVYELKDQTLHLVNLEAVKAVNNLT